MRVARFIGIGGVIAMLACNGETSPVPTSPVGEPTPPTSTPTGIATSPTTVSIQDFFFTPATITVRVNSVVRFVNNGLSVHTATSDTRIWDSGTLAPPTNGVSGQTFDVVFDRVGVFPFHCSTHPPDLFPGFVGTVVVTP